MLQICSCSIKELPLYFEEAGNTFDDNLYSASSEAIEKMPCLKTLKLTEDITEIIRIKSMSLVDLEFNLEQLFINFNHNKILYNDVPGSDKVVITEQNYKFE